MNAAYSLSVLADRAFVGLLPPARGAAVAATLRQVAEIARDLPLSYGDLQDALMWLCQARENDDARISGRRATCRELADLLADAHDGHGHGHTWRFVARFVTVCEAVVAHLDASTDPRHQAMVETARREADELRCLVTVI